ncbi:MAG: hypothetical protein ACRCZE_04310 [Candidatus Altimarinota bacterium]
MNSKNLHSAKHNQSEHSEEISEVRVRHTVAELMREKRYAFQRAVFEMESDPNLAELVKMGSGRKEAGLLRGMVDELNNFEDQYLGDDHFSAEASLQLDALEKIFDRGMNKLIINWASLQNKYDWGTLARTLESDMLKAAKVVGLDSELKVSIKKWFSGYQKKQRQEKLYVDRDKLNMEALQAHQQLAYYKSNGGSREVIEDIRAKIQVIDDQLRDLPVDPQNAPAFSSLNPNNPNYNREKVVIKNVVRPNEPAAKEFKKSKWAEPEDTKISARKMQQMKEELKARKLAEQKSEGGVRGFLKKIPLLGRLF